MNSTPAAIAEQAATVLFRSSGKSELDDAKQIAAARYAIELEREAKERQLSGLRNVGSSLQVYGNDEFRRSSAKAAEKFGISERSVESAKSVVKHAVPEQTGASASRSKQRKRKGLKLR